MNKLEKFLLILIFIFFVVIFFLYETIVNFFIFFFFFVCLEIYNLFKSHKLSFSFPVNAHCCLFTKNNCVRCIKYQQKLINKLVDIFYNNCSLKNPKIIYLLILEKKLNMLMNLKTNLIKI